MAEGRRLRPGVDLPWLGEIYNHAMRRLAVAPLALLALTASAVARAPQAEELRLPDGTGVRADPLAPGNDVRVFVFVRRDCPIANRYAPELVRLQRDFPAAAGSPVRVFLVYVDPADTAPLIAAHQQEFALALPWFVDGTHALARRAGATVTPEAAVYGPAATGGRVLLYRGRIDDRFVDVGHTRPTATVHELRDAIADALAGRQPAAPGGPAIGCFIEDAR